MNMPLNENIEKHYATAQNRIDLLCTNVVLCKQQFNGELLEWIGALGALSFLFLRNVLRKVWSMHVE